MNEPQSTAPNATIASSNSSVSAEADAVRVSKDVNVPNASQAPALTLGVLARWTWLVGAVALLACLFLWQKINGLQEILARQTFDATAMAQEAKGLAKEAAELSRDSAAHLSLMTTQCNKISLMTLLHLLRLKIMHQLFTQCFKVAHVGSPNSPRVTNYF